MVLFRFQYMTISESLHGNRPSISHQMGSYERISLSCLDTCASVQITYGGKSLRKWLYMCYWCIKVRHGRRLQSCQNTACRSVRDRSQLATTTQTSMLSEMGCMVTNVRHGRRLRSCQNTACRSVRDSSQLATTTQTLCCQKWVAWLPMLLFSDDDTIRTKSYVVVVTFEQSLNSRVAKKRTTGAGCFQISWALFSVADWLRNRAILFLPVQKIFTFLSSEIFFTSPTVVFITSWLSIYFVWDSERVIGSAII